MDQQQRQLARPRFGDEGGQAVVEAAIILPAMIFLLLVIIQLTMLQQARLAVEYAAFSAARAGIVMNMNNGSSGANLPVGTRDGPMRQAAVLAVLPTFGRADSILELTKTLARFETQDAVLRTFRLPQIRVAILNPTQREFQGQTHLNNREIDFDDVRPAVAPSTLLSVQVRYLYELRVPFANKMIQAIWLATQVGKNNLGGLSSWEGKDLTGPKIGSDRGADAVSTTRSVALAKGAIADGTPEGLNIGALTLASMGAKPVYLLPVNAWYTMRMQSNPYLKWAP